MGADLWTQTFEQWGLFTPHEDYCDSSTEVFVSISGTASRGFCMEKNERTAATWDTARDTCASDKRRLPEPGEYKFACVNATGLNNMTDDYEWASNFSYPIAAYNGSSSVGAIGAAYIGNGNCYTGSIGWIAYSAGGGSQESKPYRCVR